MHLCVVPFCDGMWSAKSGLFFINSCIFWAIVNFVFANKKAYKKLENLGILLGSL